MAHYSQDSPLLHQLFLRDYVFLMFYLFLRERECKQGRGMGWGATAEDLKPVPQWLQWAWCGAQTHEPNHNFMTWAEVRCSTHWATEAPPKVTFYIDFSAGELWQAVPELCAQDKFKFQTHAKSRILTCFYSLCPKKRSSWRCPFKKGQNIANILSLAKYSKSRPRYLCPNLTL